MGKRKILIMDDEKCMRDLTKEILVTSGYVVECAKDGVEVIEMYKSAKESGKHFDLVLMDLVVYGGVGGTETVYKLHAIDPDAKVIVFSGYIDNPAMTDFEKYGFVAAIPKPFKINEMCEILQKVMM